MVDKLSNYLLDNVLCKGEKVEGDEREILNFGITRIIEDVPKYIIMISLALITKTLFEFFLVCTVTIAYKTFIGGAHARTNFICLISSNVIFFTPIVLSKLVKLNFLQINLAYVFIGLFSIYIILKYAPADTEEVPILKKEKRTKLKIQGFISLSIILFISYFLINNIEIKELVLFNVAIIDIVATKPIYRLFKCKYSYESEEFKDYYLRGKERKIIA